MRDMPRHSQHSAWRAMEHGPSVPRQRMMASASSSNGNMDHPKGFAYIESECGEKLSKMPSAMLRCHQHYKILAMQVQTNIRYRSLDHCAHFGEHIHQLSDGHGVSELMTPSLAATGHAPTSRHVALAPEGWCYTFTTIMPPIRWLLLPVSSIVATLPGMESIRVWLSATEEYT